MRGMSPIVQNMARLVMGFVLIFGLYIASSGQDAPGGGFAGAVIALSCVVLGVLAFGGEAAKEIIAEHRCQMFAALGAMIFLVVAPAGLWAVRYYVEDQLSPDSPFRQTVRHLGPLLADLSLALQVGAGLVGLFMALVIATRRAMPKE